VPFRNTEEDDESGYVQNDHEQSGVIGARCQGIGVVGVFLPQDPGSPDEIGKQGQIAFA
jgi:hypothetical protein